MKYSKSTLAVLISYSLVFCPHGSQAQTEERPLIRATSYPAAEFEAFAEAQGHTTLSQHLDHARPGKEMEQRLIRALEKAQTTWLSGSLEQARSQFKEVARLVLEADWRESQREAIHYSILRLAQTATLPTEKEEWLKKAIASFPDLLPDDSLFPPPLLEAYRTLRQRELKFAKSYTPQEHFPDHRLLLINGKRYVLTPALRIRLPQAVFRVTALSDSHPPLSEKLSLQQLQVFKIAAQAIADGECHSPGLVKLPTTIKSADIAFNSQCLRSSTPQGWRTDSDSRESFALDSPASGLTLASPAPVTVSSSKKHWLWIGLTTLTAGAIYVIAKNQNSRESGEPKVQPVHRQGFE